MYYFCCAKSIDIGVCFDWYPRSTLFNTRKIPKKRFANKKEVVLFNLLSPRITMDFEDCIVVDNIQKLKRHLPYAATIFLIFLFYFLRFLPCPTQYHEPPPTPISTMHPLFFYASLAGGGRWNLEIWSFFFCQTAGISRWRTARDIPQKPLNSWVLPGSVINRFFDWCWKVVLGLVCHVGWVAWGCPGDGGRGEPWRHEGWQPGVSEGEVSL